MTYRLLTPALAEIRESADFYEKRVSGLGADFLDEVDAAIDRILQFPEAWARLGADFRRCNLRRFPYSVIYSIIGSGDRYCLGISPEPGAALVAGESVIS